MSKAQDYLKTLGNGSASSTPSSKGVKSSSSSYLRNLEKENSSPVKVKARALSAKVSDIKARNAELLAQATKFNLKKDTMAVAREMPRAMGQVFGGVAKAIASPVATMAARPFQAVSALAGASEDSIDKFSSKISGGLIAPTPRNFADVEKDAGRAIQTAVLPYAGLTMAKLATVGGAGGLGVSMEQGNDILSKETGINVGIGAGGGVLLSGASKLLNRVRGARGASTAPEVPPTVPEVPPAVPAVPTGPAVPPPPVVPPSPIARVLGRGEVPPPQTKPVLGQREAMTGTTKIGNMKWTGLEQQGYSKGQLAAIMGKVNEANPSGRFTPQEIMNVANKMIPDNKPAFKSTAIIKGDRGSMPTLVKSNKHLASEVPTTPGTGNIPVSQVGQKGIIPETPVSTASETNGTTFSQESAPSGAKASPSGEIPAFQSSTEVAQKAQAEAYISNGNEDHVLAVAQGRTVDPSLNKSAAFKVLEEKYANAIKAKEPGAIEKLVELSKSNVVSQAGQDLSFTGMGLGSDGPAGLLSIARNVKEKALEKSGINLGKEVEKSVAEVSAKIKKGSSIEKALSDFVDKITCK